MGKQFYSGCERPKTVASPSGKKVYEWTYYDKVGNLKTDHKNLYEQIQSYKNQVDYKARIKQAMANEEITDIKGVGEIYGTNSNDIYLDCGQCDGTVDGAIAFVQNAIKNEVEQQRHADASGQGASQKASQVVQNNVESGKVGTAVTGNETNGTSGSGSVVPNGNAVPVNQQQGGER